MARPEISWLQPLAEAVRTQRTKLRLTQQQVSVLAGCGPVFIYDVESGRKATLRLDKLLDVLHVLGLQLTLEPGQQRLRVSEPTS
ncbi:transcriptional regulator [Corallococcus sp. AB049A]|uniref:Transcriptional regulator n=1 Tax=Corallococcus interemptor TaxID=2316720 RepID=A0A3A8Q7S6_9BACT|nr:transcriptional regulator [Corallococcus interemptor]RKI70873.1 transcriptional regulator [Corallococcus sp. AB049A]